MSKKSNNTKETVEQSIRSYRGPTVKEIEIARLKKYGFNPTPKYDTLPNTYNDTFKFLEQSILRREMMYEFYLRDPKGYEESLYNHHNIQEVDGKYKYSGEKKEKYQEDYQDYYGDNYEDEEYHFWNNE